MRSVGEVAKLMADAGLIVIVALVSPFQADAHARRGTAARGRFLEIFVDTPIEICRQRDPKGLYAKADSGKVVYLTGRDQVYEAPQAPDLVLKTTELSPQEAADRIVRLVVDRV